MLRKSLLSLVYAQNMQRGTLDNDIEVRGISSTLETADKGRYAAMINFLGRQPVHAWMFALELACFRNVQCQVRERVEFFIGTTSAGDMDAGRRIGTPYMAAFWYILSLNNLNMCR